MGTSLAAGFYGHRDRSLWQWMESFFAMRLFRKQQCKERYATGAAGVSISAGGHCGRLAGRMENCMI
jgi:hypothetical protein